MNRTRNDSAWFLTLLVLLLISVLFNYPDTVSNAYTLPTEAVSSDFEEPPAIQQGLVKEHDVICYYNADGTLFTDGYKEVTTGTSTDYYYFLRNGHAFNSGYKTVVIDDTTHCFFFEDDGKAFTQGLKEVTFGDQSYYYFFHENGQAIRSGWDTQDGVTYYFQSDGRAAQSTFVTIDNNLYYFDESYHLFADGWFCVDGDYYYADSTGVIATNTVVDGYRLDANGKAATKRMILEYVNQYTEESMSPQEKIDALYQWLGENDTVYISGYEHVEAGWTWPDGWIDDFAVSLIDQWGGNCFRYAAFLGLMIREATGLPVAVYHGTLPSGNPHGWTSVYQDGEWYVYDVQQTRQGLPKEDCYKVPYPGSQLHCNGIATNLYRINPHSFIYTN